MDQFLSLYQLVFGASFCTSQFSFRIPNVLKRPISVFGFEQSKNLHFYLSLSLLLCTSQLLLHNFYVAQLLFYSSQLSLIDMEQHAQIELKLKTKEDQLEMKLKKLKLKQRKERKLMNLKTYYLEGSKIIVKEDRPLFFTR